jgi:hypothetical protein
MRRSLISRRSVALGALAGALSLTTLAGTAAAGSGSAVPISATEGTPVSGTVATYTSSVTANERFVVQMYADLLGRRPSVQDLAFATNFLDQTGTREQLASVLLGSDEYRAALVSSIYGAFLRRVASPADVSAGTSFLSGGGTDEQFEALVLGSTEYFVSEGGGTVDGFLHALYQDVLGRPIDVPAETFFTQALAGGATDADVALDVLTSTEARQDLVARWFEQYLRRSPTASDLQFFTGELAASATDEDVIAAIVGSDEYFAKVPASFASATIDWGDGTPVTSGSISGDAIAGSHTYAEEGSFAVTVTVTDLDGTFEFDQTVTVADAPLSAAPVSFTVAKKTAFTQTVATFTDGNPAAGAGDFTASIDWGDGRTSTGVIGAAAQGGFAVVGSHHYDVKGSYAITVHVQDAGGATATAVGTATVTSKGSIRPG